LLTRIAPDALDDEIAASRDDLERETGSRLPAFAYPSGAHDRAVAEAVHKAGFEIAFATRRATVDVHRVDWLRVPRMNVGGRSGLPVIRAQLSPLAIRLGRVARGAS
jgi:peptidoglycan/xylan/chitin deacetylase (PgdA/CDA1 family)